MHSAASRGSWPTWSTQPAPAARTLARRSATNSSPTSERRPSTPSIPVTPILLVEDDDEDAAHVQHCLAEVGIAADAVIRVRAVGDALAALESGPRCVLLALKLPDADGYG